MCVCVRVRVCVPDALCGVMYPCLCVHVRGVSPDAQLAIDIASVYPERPVAEFDAVSILSTYSNMENHPHMIREPRRGKKVIELSRDGTPLGMVTSVYILCFAYFKHCFLIC